MMTKAVMAGIGAVLACTAPREPVAGVPGQAGPRGIAIGDLDRTVDPCRDFYEYANGAWRATNPIPEGKPRWSRRVAAHDASRRDLQALLEGLAARTDWPTGSVEQQVGDHFAACMDPTSADAAGLTPLAPLLAEIDGVRELADLQRVIRGLHDVAIHAPFGVAGDLDSREPSNFIANVTPAALGLPGRDDYVKSEPRFAEARASYQAHIARVLELAGRPAAQATTAAAAVLALETRLAEATLDGAAAADPAATDHKLSFAQLQQLAPHMDWNAYFDQARLPRVTLNVAEPRFLQQVDRELHDTPLAVWKAYLAWQLLDAASPWMSAPLAEEAARWKGGARGASDARPRAARCTDLTEALLGDAVGKLYVERYFPPAAKARLQDMIRTLVAVLRDEVAGLPWMAPETRAKALAKLATYDVEVGYPDALARDAGRPGPTLRRDTLWANIAARRRLQVAMDRERIGKPTDRAAWLLPASSPDAYLNLQLNQIVLPAGFLAPPAFQLEASDAVNYGSIGISIAHDITHAIDTLGADLDAMGRPNHWWTDADRKAFDDRGQCVADQFEGYFIEPAVHHRGALVRNEAIGDLAGVRVAYLALVRSMKRQPVPVIDGFTPVQQFFLAWGQIRGDAVRLDAQRQIVEGDNHPVPRFRVIGPLANTPEFQQAFSCKAGAEMVRPERCTVW